MSYCMIVSTFDSKEEAMKLGSMIVEGKLAACCQVITGVESIYMWQGEMRTSQEFILQAKTRGYLAEKVEKFILSHHSYQTPEILKINIDDGNEKYLEWLDCCTNRNCGIC